MKYARLPVLFLALILFVFGNGYAAASNDGGPEAKYKAGELLVKFRPGVRGAAKSDAHARAGAETIMKFPALRIQHVKLKNGQGVEAAIAVYAKNPNVEYAEPNYIVSADAFPNDPQFNDLWGMHNTGQTGGTSDADIDAPEAWNITTGSGDVVVAVIDSGVDYTHEDLSANIWVNDIEYYGAAGVDDDGNGYVDDFYGIDSFNGDSDPMDDHSHGTHVSGTIGAVGNNGVGVSGVNWNVKMVGCKFLNSAGNGDTAGAIECLEYVRALKAGGVNIVASNNSWGGGAYSQALYDAISAQGDILFMAAAGNLSFDNDEYPSYPCGYYLPNIIAVAATDHNDGMVWFSNYGRRTVHIGAPGEDILSTVAGGLYEVHSGTSMATPHVAGVAALLKSQDMNRDWIDIKNLILSGGDSISTLDVTTISGKRLNAHGSLACIDSPVFSALKYPSDPQAGAPATLSALSINCASSVGPVTMEASSGDVVNLYDNGVAPDLEAGDGIFSATWTPSAEGWHMHFSSPAGSEVVNLYFKLTTSRVNEGNIRTSYSQTFEARDGVTPYTWSISLGSLPEGLTLNSSTGEITGTPVETGIFWIVVRVVDAESSVLEKEFWFAVVDSQVIEIWNKIYDGGSYESGYDIYESAYDIAVDTNGNVYVAGNSDTGVDKDWLTIKYDANGNVVWAKPYDSGGKARGVAVDTNGNVYVTGYSWAGADYDWLTIKYDANGNVVWAKPYDSGGEAHDVAVDTNGNVYVTGYSWDGADHDWLTIKYDANGDVVWAEPYGGGGSDGARGVAVDTDGNVYVTGYSWDGAASIPLTIKYDANGNVVWAKPYSSGYGNSTEAVAVDGSGNVYVTGYADDGTHYGYGTIKYDSSGNVAWSRIYDYGGDMSELDAVGVPETAYGIAVDAYGSVYVAGHYMGLFPGARIDENYLVVKYDSSGNVVWARAHDEGFQEYAQGVAVDTNGNVYVTGYSSGEKSDIITVKYSVIFGIGTKWLPDATFGEYYSRLLKADGGLQPYTWSIAGQPAWLTLDADTGVISGMPDTVGSYALTVQATDANGETASRVLSLGAYELPVITTPSLPYGIVGTPYSYILSASGGLAPYLWGYVGGWPNGLIMYSSSGELSGTPTEAGAYNFTVQVTDANSKTDSKSLSISVYEPLVLTASSLPDGYTGTAYSRTLAADGGLQPYTWSITSGSLPIGLSLNASTGELSGIPDAAGTYSFTVTVTDANSETDSRTFSLEVFNTTTYYMQTSSNCGQKTYKSAPQYSVLGTSSGDCSAADTLSVRFKGTKDMLVGYLANSGYSTNTLVTGASEGSNLSFLAKDSGGTGYVHLVEVNPSDGTVIQVLSTVSVSLTAGVRAYVTDISGLSGTVSAGNSFGIMLSMSTASRSVNEIKWGKTNGGAGFEQWITLVEIAQ
jgi:subtilisin family serine protease